MNSGVLVWLTFVLVVSFLCLWKPNASRILLGLFFLVMAIGVNIPTVLTDPQTYVEWGRTVTIPFYRWVFQTLVMPNPALVVIPAALFEVAASVMMLSSGNRVKIGLAGAILFLLATTPLGKEEWPNAILALAMVRLFFHKYDRSFPAYLLRFF